METREELLNGLYFVRKMLKQIVSTKNEQVKIVAQFRQQRANIETSGVKNQSKLLGIMLGIMVVLFYLMIAWATGRFPIDFFLAVICAGIIYLQRDKRSKLKRAAVVLLVCSLGMTLMNIVRAIMYGTTALVVFMAVLFAIAFVLVKTIIKRKNQQIDQENAATQQYNQEIQRQYDETVRRLKQLTKEMVDGSQSWYPRSYYCEYAVEFFVEAVENYRADSVKEMVNLFENSEHQRRMESGQQEINASLQQSLLNQEQIKKELRYANVLNLAQLTLQAQTVQAVEANTQAVRAGSASVTGAIRKSGESVTGAVRENTDIVRDIRGMLRKKK